MRMFESKQWSFVLQPCFVAIFHVRKTFGYQFFILAFKLNSVPPACSCHYEPERECLIEWYFLATFNIISVISGRQLTLFMHVCHKFHWYSAMVLYYLAQGHSHYNSVDPVRLELGNFLVTRPKLYPCADAGFLSLLLIHENRKIMGERHILCALLISLS